MADRSGMGPLLIGIGALLLCTGPRGAVSVTIKAAVGSDVTMVPTYTGDPSEINWKLDGNKLVDMELRPLSIKFFRLKDRATIERNGTLTIRGVTKQDSKDNGRYLEYKAEAVVNEVYQETDVTLIVLDCPDKPTISNQSTPEQFILQCNSSTPEVTYEWRNETTTLSKGQFYTANRTKQDVNVTCVVDNEVCRNNKSITIPPHIPVSSRRLHWGVLVSIIVIHVGSLRIVVLVWIYDDRENKPETDERKKDTPLMENDTGGVKGDPGDVEKGTATHVVDGTGSLSCGSIALNVSPKVAIRCMELWKNDMLDFVVKLGELVEGQPTRIKTLYLTIDQVDPAEHEEYTAEVLQSNGETHKVTMKGNDGIVTIDPEGDGLKLTVPDTENVTKVAWKKGGNTLYDWKICGVEHQTSNKTLQPGDSGTYQVDVHSAENRITKNEFNLKVEYIGVTGPVIKSEDKRKITLEVVKTVTYDPPENGHPEKEPISSVTFHPFKLTNMAAITWMKNGELLVDRQTPHDEDRINLAENGDLELRHVTPADKGTYTVQCEGLTAEQEFCLVV